MAWLTRSGGDPGRFGWKYRGSNLWHLAEVDYIVQHFAVTPTDRILELGCGEGIRAVALAMRGLANVTGLDKSDSLLSQARQYAAKMRMRVAFVMADPRHSPFIDESFDGVAVLGDLIGRAEGPRDVVDQLAEARRVLRPGGALWLGMDDGEWVKAHYRPDSIEPSVGGFVYYHREFSADGARLLTRTVVADSERGLAVDDTSIEWLYSERQISALLHHIGFQSIAFHRPHRNLAAECYLNEDLRPRHLVSCRAPRRYGRASPHSA